MRLPTPRLAGQLPIVDPYRDRIAYWNLISELYRAELAALEGFGLLADPRFVQADPIFLRAMEYLVEDESRHAKYYDVMLDRLGFAEMAPVSDRSEWFWTEYRSGKRFFLPLKAGVAALFCMLSEGLGYAFLAHLRDATVDAEFKRLIAEHVDDEANHLRVSMTVMQRVLKNESVEALIDLLPHLVGYFLMARVPARAALPTAERLGFDVMDLASSSLRFVRDMILIVLEDGGFIGRAGPLLRRMTDPMLSRQVLRVAYTASGLPEPPLFWRGLVALGRARQRREPTAPAPRSFPSVASFGLHPRATAAS